MPPLFFSSPSPKFVEAIIGRELLAASKFVNPKTSDFEALTKAHEAPSILFFVYLILVF